LLTELVILFSNDDEVSAISQLCRAAHKIDQGYVDGVNNRRLFRRLDDLRDISGGDTEADVKAERDAQDFEYFIRHIATDWDFDSDLLLSVPFLQ